MQKMKKLSKKKKRILMLKQKNGLGKLLEKIFGDVQIQKKKSFWFGLFDFIILKEEMDPEWRKKFKIAKRGNDRMEKDFFDEMRMVFGAFNLGRIVSLFERLLIKKTFFPSPFSNFEEFFADFLDVLRFTNQNEHKRPSNLQLYIFYILLRFTKFMVTFSKLYSSSANNFILNKTIKKILGQSIACKVFCEILNSKEQKIDSHGQLTLVISLSFLNRPREFFQINEKLVVAVLKERTVEIASISDFDDFELVNDLVEDF